MFDKLDLSQYYLEFNHKRWFLVSVALFICGIGLGIAFPNLLPMMVKKQINTAPGGQVRPIYEKIPFFLNFKVHLWNITNKQDVIDGKKPKLQEVGPYHFEVWKEKFDLEDNEEDDTLVYHFRQKYVFRPDLSAPLTGDETVVMIHPVLMGLFLTINVDKQPMLPKIAEAVNNLWHEPADAFYTGRAMDIIFDGVATDCTSEHTITRGVCGQFRDNAQFAEPEKNHLKFSLIGNSNYTDQGVFKVYRGKKHYQDTGRVIEFNGEDEMGFYEEDECNAYYGTDQTVFPAFMKPEEGVGAFEPLICRTLYLEYVGKEKYRGLPGLRFELDMSSPMNTKECFCRDEDYCPPKGSIDLFRCNGIPLMGTLPHFYKAEQLLENVASGVNPEYEKHATFSVFEIMTGTPLRAGKRMQFNMDLKPIETVPLMQTMPEMIFPIFWVEESVDMGKEIVNQLKFSLFLAKKVVALIKWLMILAGLAGVAVCSAMIMIQEEMNK